MAPGERNLLQAGEFAHGKQSGKWKRYHPNGELYDVGEYVDGKKAGAWKCYDMNGRLTCKKTN